eukprot:674114-Pyramimonas_sp.AAC.1
MASPEDDAWEAAALAAFCSDSDAEYEKTDVDRLDGDQRPAPSSPAADHGARRAGPLAMIVARAAEEERRRAARRPGPRPRDSGRPEERKSRAEQLADAREVKRARREAADEEVVVDGGGLIVVGARSEKWPVVHSAVMARIPRFHVGYDKRWPLQPLVMEAMGVADREPPDSSHDNDMSRL